MISIGNMNCVVLNPVPQMIVSTRCSVPSAVRTPSDSMRSTESVTTSTLSRCRAGSQWELKSTRLHPNV